MMDDIGMSSSPVYERNLWGGGGQSQDEPGLISLGHAYVIIM